MKEIIILDETNGKSELGKMMKIISKINGIKYYKSINEWLKYEEGKQEGKSLGKFELENGVLTNVKGKQEGGE